MTLISIKASELLPTFLFKHCTNLKHILQIHGVIITTGLHTNIFLLAGFIHTCSSLKLSDHAYSLFTKPSSPPNNTYLYNTMIKALSNNHHHHHSATQPIHLYNRMRALSIPPDTYSFPFLLKSVTQLSVGTQIHSQTLTIGFHSNLHVAAALIQMYSSCGSVSDAQKLFDGMNVKDVTLWNAMIAGYVKAGDIDEASSLLDRMPVCQRNVISWTCVVSGYAQTNKPNEAIEVFRRMRMDDVKLDEVIISSVLSACGDIGALELGEWIHNYADEHGLNTTVSFKNALINMYAKSGKIEKALEIFENTNDKSVVTWTTIIAGLALHGRGREAVEIFTRMEKTRVKPNDITFIAILTACSHIGWVKTGESYFNAMKSRYGIEPRVEHYGCLINLYGRAGLLEEALEVVRRMPFEGNAAIWGSLLSAANVHKEVEVGEFALKRLVKIEPENSGNYAILSNVYSGQRRWSESMMVRKMMRDTGVRKKPGRSFVEVGNEVHGFLAGETSHCGLSRIHDVVYKMDGHLKNVVEHEQKRYSELLEFDLLV